MGECAFSFLPLNFLLMKIFEIKRLIKYFNVQKMAAIFFLLLIVSAYHITFKQFNPIEINKENILNVVKNHQEEGITTLAITSLPFWLSLRDKITNEDN